MQFIQRFFLSAIKKKKQRPHLTEELQVALCKKVKQTKNTDGSIQYNKTSVYLCTDLYLKIRILQWSQKVQTAVQKKLNHTLIRFFFPFQTELQICVFK